MIKNEQKERLEGSKGEGRKRRLQRRKRQIKRVLKRETKQLLHYRRVEFYESVKIDYS